MTRSEKHRQLLDGGLPRENGSRVAYSIEQAALASGRSRSRIYLAIKNKELTAVKDGRATLVTDTELRRWVNSMPTIGRAHSEVSTDA